MTVLADPIHLLGAHALQDPYPVYDRMRAQAPVHRIGSPPFYAVCGWDAVIDAVNRVEDFSSNLTAALTYHEDGSVTPFDMADPGGDIYALATADDPAHALHRKIVLPHLSAKRVRIIEEFAARTADRLWDENLRDGRIEWMSAMANRLPMMVVLRLLGLPDDDADNLIRLAYATTTMLDGVVTPARLETAGLAVMELSGYVMKHFENDTDRTESGLISDLAARCAHGELSVPAAMGMMITLFSAAWILVTRPEIQHQVREDPELLNAFIEEALRFEPPFRAHYRHVRRDTTLSGVHVPAGSHLLLLWGAANRDPSYFQAPNDFRLDRSGAKSHVTFGKGVHFCMGAALARLEAQIVLRMLLDRTTWIEASDIGEWLPTILVRRLKRLELAVR